MKGRIITALILLFFGIKAFSQIEYSEGKPLFPGITDWHDASVEQSQLDLMRSLDQPKDQPLRFAIPIMVSLNPVNAGKILRTGGETVWIMPVTSKGALSLNVILEPFNLPDGAYLFVYDEKHEVIRGPFTKQSSNAGTLPVLPVPGDRLILECHFQGKSIPSDAIGVKQVAHDFAGFFAYADVKDQYYGSSGTCEIDIGCSGDINYLRSSRSVCRLLVSGTDLCSGVLVNNTGQVNKPYVLTAQHCIQSASDATNTIFLFNYASPWCDGPDRSNMHYMTGSSLKATNESVDFSLVELFSFPSLVFRPYLSGWDINSTIPTSTYTIHHPEGDVMKISKDSDPPVISSYPIGDYITNGFWKILDWELGTTESGSSGAPLFDQYYRIRGTLTGGSADCVVPENDYFARIGRMFNISTVPSANLKPWLDPDGTGTMIASGRDPFAYNLSLSDTLENIPDGDAGQVDEYISPAFGYSTGINSDMLITYAEAIPFTGTGEIAWISFNVAYSSYFTVADSIRVFVWSGGTEPGAIIASKRFRISESKNDSRFEIDFGRTIAVTGPFYVGYRVYYKDPLGQPQTQFAVRHSTPYLLDNQNTAWFSNGSVWKPFTQHPSFPMATSLDVNVIMVENSVLNPVDDDTIDLVELRVYPNPFTRDISFELNDISEDTFITICDNAGQVVYARKFRYVFPGKVTIEPNSFIPGIYHYRIENDYDTFSGTIIKIIAQ